MAVVDPALHVYPALQMVHTLLAPAPNLPAGQITPVGFVEVAGQANPPGEEQGLHALEPAKLNCPAVQAVRVGVVDPWLLQTYPAWQLRQGLAPPVEYLPAVHDWQFSCVKLPLHALPAEQAQSVQTAAFDWLNLPLGQGIWAAEPAGQ